MVQLFINLIYLNRAFSSILIELYRVTFFTPFTVASFFIS